MARKIVWVSDYITKDMIAAVLLAIGSKFKVKDILKHDNGRVQIILED